MIYNAPSKQLICDCEMTLEPYNEILHNGWIPINSKKNGIAPPNLKNAFETRIEINDRREIPIQISLYKEPISTSERVYNFFHGVIKLIGIFLAVITIIPIIILKSKTNTWGFGSVSDSFSKAFEPGKIAVSTQLVTRTLSSRNPTIRSSNVKIATLLPGGISENNTIPLSKDSETQTDTTSCGNPKLYRLNGKGNLEDIIENQQSSDFHAKYIDESSGQHVPAKLQCSINDSFGSSITERAPLNSCARTKAPYKQNETNNNLALFITQNGGTITDDLTSRKLLAIRAAEIAANADHKNGNKVTLFALETIFSSRQKKVPQNLRDTYHERTIVFKLNMNEDVIPFDLTLQNLIIAEFIVDHGGKITEDLTTTQLLTYGAITVAAERDIDDKIAAEQKVQQSAKASISAAQFTPPTQNINDQSAPFPHHLDATEDHSGDEDELFSSVASLPTRPRPTPSEGGYTRNIEAFKQLFPEDDENTLHDIERNYARTRQIEEFNRTRNR